MELFKNHEAMQVTSDLMRQDFSLYELEGGRYDSLATKLMAEKVIFSCMPHIMDYLHSRVIVEATHAHLLEAENESSSSLELVDKPDKPTSVQVIDGLHVEAKFKNIEFQPIIRNETLEGYDGTLIIEDYDLFAVMQPHYFDPDPGAMVFSDAVMVPFSEVTLFEPSARRAA